MVLVVVMQDQVEVVEVSVVVAAEEDHQVEAREVLEVGAQVEVLRGLEVLPEVDGMEV